MLKREDMLISFQGRINYQFKNIDILKKALVHRSFGNENREYKNINNEKLELLGDAVLDLIVTEYLYLNYKYSSEGELAKLKAMIVSEPVLASISREINIGEYLLLSKGEELTGGRERESILGDAFEALLGAIYLDSNFDITRKVILNFLEKRIINVEDNEEILDYKTILQEYTQKEFRKIPKYNILEEMGPDHNKSFKVGVSVNNETFGEGVGKNKKNAEQKAAHKACKRLKINFYETF